MDEIILALMAVTIGAVVMIAVITAVRVMIKARPPVIPVSKKDDDVCGICFGDLDERTAVCGCGKFFHDSCALPTGSCPYCGAEYSTFMLDEDNSRCPNCGRYPLGNICKCGALLPCQGTFVCECGSMIDPFDPICNKCGTRYRIVGTEETGT